jgi:stalled ribosome rescue protein Dom34
LKKKLVEEETELSNKIFLEDTTSGDEQSIREIYRGNTLDKIIKNNKLKRDEDLVDQYFEEISKRNDLVIYDKKTIIEASNNGKIEELIINDNIIEKNKELMNKVESFGGKIEILNSKTNSGMKLKGLSGMLAKKRFN